MLFGEFNQQIDEKGRVRIPAKLKSLLADGVTITKGTNGCLFVFSNAEWNDGFVEKLADVPVSDLEIQRSVRLFFSSANELEFDNQGRTLLPKNLREFADLKKDVVFIGVGNRAELWSKERYDAYMNPENVEKTEKVDQNSINFDILFAELKKYGI